MRQLLVFAPRRELGGQPPFQTLQQNPPNSQSMAAGGSAWESVAALAGAASATVAAVALLFAARQAQSGVKATELSILQNFSTQCRELFKACAEASDDPEEFGIAVGDILAHFELFCIAISNGGIDRKSHDFISETISDYLTKMHQAGWGPYVHNALDEAHVCKHLRDFGLQYRAKIKDSEAVLMMLMIPRSSF